MRLEKVSSPDYAIMVSRMADLSRRFGTGFMRESGRMISYRPQTPP